MGLDQRRKLPTRSTYAGNWLKQVSWTSCASETLVLFRVWSGDTTVRGGGKRDTVGYENVRNVNIVHFILLWHTYRIEKELVATLSLVQ